MMMRRNNGSVAGMLFGGLLFLAAFPVLWLNEGRSVTTARSLKEGAGAVVSISADKVDAEHDGSLVHLSGTATTDATLSDDEFGITIPRVLKLFRVVESYQWKENQHRDKKDKAKNRVYYTYEKVWTDSPIDSSEFDQSRRHHNPEPSVHSHHSVAEQVTLGAFRLTGGQVGRIGARQPIDIGPQHEQNLPDHWRGRLQIRDSGFYLPYRSPGSPALTQPDDPPAPPAEQPAEKPAEQPAEKPAEQPAEKPAEQPAEKPAEKPAEQPAEKPADAPQSSGGCQDEDDPTPPATNDAAPTAQPQPEQADDPTTPSAEDSGSDNETPATTESHQPATHGVPQVGDSRIRFYVVEPCAISVIAQQQGDSFVPYPTKAGRNLDMLETGSMSAAEMFEAAEAANTMLTWLLRGGGFLMMFIGLALIGSPLARMTQYVPVMGNIVSTGIALVAAGVAAALSLATIAIAWVFYRPLLGILLLLLAAAAAGVVVMLIKMKTQTGKPLDEYPGM